MTVGAGRVRLAGLFALAGAALGSCRRVPSAAPIDPLCRVEAGEGDRPFFAGQAGTRDEIEALLVELAGAHGEKIVDVGMRLVAKGEPAVPALRRALAAPSPSLRANAAYFLGVLKDRRTIPDLARAAAEDEDHAVRFEAAGALLELGDPSGFPTLVDGLAEPDARRRAKCIDVLAEVTHERFGFEPDGDPSERAAAIRRWRAWLAVRADATGSTTDAPAPK